MLDQTQVINHLVRTLGVSAHGLSGRDVAERQARWGANAVASHRARVLPVLWHQLRSPLLGLLLIAAVASYAAGERSAAVIGPTISQRAYEVGPDLVDEVLAGDAEAARFFAGGSGDRMLFDLPGYGLWRLRRAGVEAEWTRHCTYSGPERFFSYRRGGKHSGRHLCAIVSR